MSPSIVAITAQAAGLSVVSSVLAQAITAWQSNSPLSVDWEPVIKFLLLAVIQTPPNVLWQIFLEDSFPGSDQPDEPPSAKQKSSVPSAPSAPPPPQLNWRNTLAKMLLDQTAAACVNTMLLCLFLGAWEWGLAQGSQGVLGAQDMSLSASLSAATAEFWPVLVAGWRFWPWVSLGSFALVPDVATRNLVGGLAGVAWGVYLTMATAGAVPKLKEE